MPKKRVLYYWICQLAGWGFLFLIFWLMELGGLRLCLITVGVGLVISHALRWVAVVLGWMRLPAGKVWVRMLAGVLAASVVAGLVRRLIEQYLDGYSFRSLPIAVVGYLLLLLPWACLYCIVHYAGRPNEALVRAKQLEWRLARMQKEAKAMGVDSGAIMEWLRRIEAMVETDPERSREEITEFSKMLRRGYMG